ncbi:Adenylate cyclase (EC [Olavius algarvensis associated proteobacterium Delta 3]|nr:Adenylate cyclase (EC [Olavius algarvensis associated proteobacterium Delta 3]CAB5170026.1 Adenylate cyclase (EC [Olavius algarvensis associated proteobacterium Delta 3]
MPPVRKLLQGVIIGAAAASVSLILWGSGILDPWERQTWDWRARMLAAPRQATDDIVLILLDQNSLDWAVEENGLTWPWPREVYGAIIDFCRMAGAQAIAFDVLFTEPSGYGTADDKALAASMATFGRVAAPVFLGKSTGSQQRWPESVPLPPISAAGIGKQSPLNRKDILRFPRATFPIPEISSKSTVLGSVSTEPDSDGIYRRVPMFSSFDGQILPTLGLTPFLALHGNLTVHFDPHGAVLDQHKIPLDDGGRALLRYRGPSGTHKNFSAAAIIQSYLRLRDGETPGVRPDDLKGKFVFFGFSAPGLFDLRPTPVDGIYPGVEIHATVLDNFLSGDFLRHAPAGVTTTMVVGMAMAAALTATIFSSALGGMVVSAGFLILPAVLSLAAYSMGFWLPLMVQVAGVALALAISLIVNYSTEGRQKRFIKNAFRQYLSPIVIDELIRYPERLKLGGERRTLSIFFSDLQGFTSISERLSPEVLTTLLNAYLSAMTEIIHQEKGTVDKYEGDAIVAFWNAPLEVPDHAACIVQASLRCQSRLAELRPVFFEQIEAELHMRIGINTGPAVVGNMGSRTRFDYTMLGDAVNLAARLEGANKQFGTYTMISESTRQMMGDEFPVRELARVAVVGKKEPVVVYEPMFPDEYENRRRVLETFENGLKCFYDGRFAEAAELFSTIMEDDAPAARYYRKCQELATAKPENWDGVWTMTAK